MVNPIISDTATCAAVEKGMKPASPEKGKNKRITHVGKDLEDHLIQLPSFLQYFPIKPCQHYTMYNI